MVGESGSLSLLRRQLAEVLSSIVAGVESGMRTILELSGVTRQEEFERYPYRPACVLDSVADIKL